MKIAFTSLCLLTTAVLSAQILDTQFPTTNGNVQAICIHGNTLYIGGSFTQVGNLPRTNIAAIDLTTKSVTPWAPSVNSDVVDIEAANGKVYFCGHFTQVNLVSRNALAAVDSASGNLESLNPNIVFPGIPGMQTGTVSSLEVADGLLYLAGYFISINGSSRKNVAAVDLASGNLHPLSVEPNIPVNVIEIENDRLYLGGPFFSVNGASRKGFAAVNRLTGTLLPWNPSSDDQGNTIHAIVPDGDSVFISGVFFSLAGSGNCHLAKTDMDGVPSNWHPFSCSGVPFPIANALAKWDPFLVVGGEFSNFSGQNRNHLAMAQAHTGALTSWNPAPNDNVLSLATNDSLLVVGGRFTSISGVSRGHLAVYSRDASTGTHAPTSQVVKLTGYPNPVQGSFTVPIPDNQLKNIVLYTQDGKRTDVPYEMNGQQLIVRTKALPAGRYFIQFKTMDNHLYTASFIKM